MTDEKFKRKLQDHRRIDLDSERFYYVCEHCGNKIKRPRARQYGVMYV